MQFIRKDKKAFQLFYLSPSSAIFGLLMSKNYNHLGLEQRYQIEALLKANCTQKWIAAYLGVHPSTIHRELKRNIACRGRTSGSYIAGNAQRKTMIRHKEKRKHIILNDQLKEQIIYHLEVDKWSPELISKCSPGPMVSHERIYQWIWECKFSHKAKDKEYTRLYKFLKHGRRHRKRGNRKDNRGIIPNRVPIAQRPKIVERRTRTGDIEVDLMMGKNHKGAVLVMTDRATLFTRLQMLPGKQSKDVNQAIRKNLKSNSFKAKTLTFDNDLAFSGHESIANQFKVKTYFTRPYTSQDKGTVENRIGVIRRFIPKNTNLINLEKAELKKIETKINNRPIRKFNYLTA